MLQLYNAAANAANAAAFSEFQKMQLQINCTLSVAMAVYSVVMLYTAIEQFKLEQKTVACYRRGCAVPETVRPPSPATAAAAAAPRPQLPSSPAALSCAAPVPLCR